MIGALRRLRHGRLRQLAPLWLPLGKTYRAVLSGLGASFSVSHQIGPYGPFKLHGHFAFSDFEHWGGDHNNGFEPCVERCRRARCVLDIGAHIGLVTLPVSSVLADGGVLYAFEPAQVNSRYLRHHLELNRVSNVVVVTSLVGADERDEVDFFEQDGDTGMNSVVARKNRAHYRLTHHSQVSLDGFCTAHSLAPEVIKIDVEGAEMEGLRGAAETLQTCRPTIFLSVHPAELQALGHSVEALRTLARELGYTCCHMDGSPAEELGLAEYLLEGDH